MSPDAILAVVLLGPPAVFGVAVVIGDALERRWARRLHPSSVPAEDRPEWGQP